MKNVSLPGYAGPGMPSVPVSINIPEGEFEQCSFECVRAVIEYGEYRYDRDRFEGIHTIVDVGHNLGAFAIWACKCWWPGLITRVDAYEPNAKALEIALLNTLGLPVVARRAAVTVDSEPLFCERGADGRANWGGGRTYSVTYGERVQAVHPRNLPSADVLKVDAEGVDLEVFENYQHWSTVKIAMFEWHHVEHREPMQDICRSAGLVQLRDDDGARYGQGQQIWGRV